MVAVSPALTVSPISGPTGTPIVFNGSGFAADSSTTVTWSGGTACLITTNASGVFSCPAYTMPPAVLGAHTFTGKDASGDTGTASFTIVPHLALTPSVGPAGTVVTFSGTGYEQTSCSGCFTVTWTGGAGTVCSGTFNSVGSASCSAEIAPGTSSRSYVYTGSDQYPNTAAATFVVNYTPKLTLSPISGPVGTNVTVTGSSFEANSPILVTWRATQTVCSPAANASGGFACTFQVPGSIKGAWDVNASDANGAVGQAPFTIVPHVTVSPSTGPAGTVVTFVGTGYEQTSCNGCFSVTWTGTPTTVCTGTFNSVGRASCSFEIPPGTGVGSYVFTGSDQYPNTAAATFNVNYTPKLSLSPISGPNGINLTVTGSRFEASSPILVTWRTSSTVCSPTANASGGFGCTFLIPAAPKGSYYVNATDANGAVGQALYTVVPHLTVSPSSGLAGTALTFTGTGFGQTSCIGCFSVTWTGTPTTVCTGSFGVEGGATCKYTLSSSLAPGAYVFTGSDLVPNTASATFTVVGPSSLSVAPISGPPGTTLTLLAANFAHSGAIQVAWASGTVCRGTTNASGGYSCTFTVGLGTTAGTYAFTATDTKGNSSGATFTVVPGLTASPAGGTPGTIVTFTGAGFEASDAVWVNLSGGATACRGTASSEGLFSCSYTVPDAPAGTLDFSATDTHGLAAVAAFVVTPSLSATPAGGPPNTDVTFTGHGFAGSSPVSITWSGGPACSMTSTAVGNVSCSFVIPAGTVGGSYEFTATDAAADQTSVGFFVESVPGVPVKFSEKGLPAGTEWWANVTNGPSESSTGATLTLSVPSGTYSYAVASANKDYAAAGGTFSVRTKEVAVKVKFAEVTFPVGFSETGLPSGAKWCVVISGQKPHCSTSSSQSFLEPNASYSYSLTDTAKGYTAPGGAFTVDGTPASESVTFTSSGQPRTPTGAAPAVGVPHEHAPSTVRASDVAWVVAVAGLAGAGVGLLVHRRSPR